MWHVLPECTCCGEGCCLRKAGAVYVSVKKYIKVARKTSRLSQKVYDAVRVAIPKSDWGPMSQKFILTNGSGGLASRLQFC